VNFKSIRKEYEKLETLISSSRTMTEKGKRVKYNEVVEVKRPDAIYDLNVEGESSPRLKIRM